jgi:hypothetical protein
VGHRKTCKANKRNNGLLAKDKELSSLFNLFSKKSHCRGRLKAILIFLYEKKFNFSKLKKDLKEVKKSAIFNLLYKVDSPVLLHSKQKSLLLFLEESLSFMDFYRSEEKIDREKIPLLAGCIYRIVEKAYFERLNTFFFKKNHCSLKAPDSNWYNLLQIGNYQDDPIKKIDEKMKYPLFRSLYDLYARYLMMKFKKSDSISTLTPSQWFRGLVKSHPFLKMLIDSCKIYPQALDLFKKNIGHALWSLKYKDTAIYDSLNDIIKDALSFHEFASKISSEYKPIKLDFQIIPKLVRSTIKEENKMNVKMGYCHEFGRAKQAKGKCGDEAFGDLESNFERVGLIQGSDFFTYKLIISFYDILHLLWNKLRDNQKGTGRRYIFILDRRYKKVYLLIPRYTQNPWLNALLIFNPSRIQPSYTYVSDQMISNFKLIDDPDNEAIYKKRYNEEKIDDLFFNNGEVLANYFSFNPRLWNSKSNRKKLVGRYVRSYVKDKKGAPIPTMHAKNSVDNSNSLDNYFNASTIDNALTKIIDCILSFYANKKRSLLCDNLSFNREKRKYKYRGLDCLIENIKKIDNHAIAYLKSKIPLLNIKNLQIAKERLIGGKYAFHEYNFAEICYKLASYSFPPHYRDPDQVPFSSFSPMNGYAFALSYHYLKANNCQIYFCQGGSLTRFYLGDMKFLWKHFFGVKQEINAENRIRIDHLKGTLCDVNFEFLSDYLKCTSH